MTITVHLVVLEARRRSRIRPPQRDADIDPTGALSALSDDDLAAIIHHRPLSPATTQALAEWERAWLEIGGRHEDRDGLL